ncbi:MAG: hypothetical protein HUU55_09460 [Myxococcales bacterium]|nr:hypothetical protein [Myxococcales bacterium]
MKSRSYLILLRWSAFLLVAVAVFVTGWGAGILEGVVTVALMYPAALGVIAGIVTAFWVQLTFVAQPRLVAVLSLLIGLAAVVGLHSGRYSSFQAEFGSMVRDSALEGMTLPSDADHIAEVSRSVPDSTMIHEQLDLFLMEETGSGGWLGFLRLELASGIRTLPAGGLDVAEPWVAAFWFLEWLVVSWITGSFGVRLATFPRCEQCHRWLTTHSVGGTPELARIAHEPEATNADPHVSSGVVGLFCPQHGAVMPAGKKGPPSPNLAASSYCCPQTHEQSGTNRGPNPGETTSTIPEP